MSAFAKAINAETRECRLVRLSPAVRGKLARHDVHWAKRTKVGHRAQSTDALLITSQDLWAELVPYFDYVVEKRGGKHSPTAVSK